MTITGLHYLPLILFILFPTTFFGTYIAAVLQGHVKAEFPYISDTATCPPESCFFAQLINLGSVLLCIVVYVRYCEICTYYENYSMSPKIIRLNKAGVWFGVLSCLGLNIIANFQETNVKYVHYFGALLCFGLGTIYFWIQALCSYHMHPVANSILMAHVRVSLAMICTLFFFVVAIAGLMAHLQFDGKPRHWTPDDKGWKLHIASTISEWVVAICFCIYIITFYSEFGEISFSHPQLILTKESSSLLEEGEDILS